MTRRKSAEPLLRPADVRRLELAVERLRRGAATLLQIHARQVDRLSQRMQVVVTEAELLRGALERATGKGRMDDVPLELGRVTAGRGRGR